MAKSIDVDSLDIYYGDFLAVQGVSMHIRARSVTAFIGPSGCGKSTVLRSLNRMHEVIPGARVEGKVTVDGQSLYDHAVDPVAVRRHTGMVSQRLNPVPTMPIYDNVPAGNRPNPQKMQKSEAHEIVESSLTRAHLRNQATARPDTPRNGRSGAHPLPLRLAAGTPLSLPAPPPPPSLSPAPPPLLLPAPLVGRSIPSLLLPPCA